jgi:hypothetical protein
MAGGGRVGGEAFGVLALESIDTRQPGEIRLNGAVDPLDQDLTMPLVSPQDLADQARGQFSGGPYPPGTLEMDKVRRQFQQRFEPTRLGITGMNQGDRKAAGTKALQRTAKVGKVHRLGHLKPQHDLSGLQTAAPQQVLEDLAMTLSDLLNMTRMDIQQQPARGGMRQAIEGMQGPA